MITMQDVAGSLGIGIPVLWFLMAFMASIPASWLWRFVPGGAQGRHLYAAASGALLSHCAFGASSNAYFMLPIGVSYAAMLFNRRMCGVISAVFAFGYLIACHVAFMSGDAWKSGGIDSTGSMMVLTLKVTSAAFNYQDGLIEDEKTLREAQKNYRLKTLPSFMAYLGYCFNCGTHLVGPVFELRDYMDWTENKGLWDPSQKPPPSPYIPTFLSILKAFLCMAIFMYLSGAYPLSFVTQPEFLEWGYWHRVWYQYLCSFGTRWKYYFIWSLSEAAVMVSGFGFSGWSTSAPSEEPTAKWSRAHNVDIVNVELATSAAEIPKYWNIHVSVWLRHYVYERLVVKGKRPGFRQLLATQVVSAVWHGLYAGYFLFFVNSALMIAGARVIYKWQQVIPKSNFLAVNLGTLVGFFYTAFVLNLTVIGFQVLYYADTITAYRAVYFTGTLLPVALILLGKFVKPPRAGQSSKVKKEA